MKRTKILLFNRDAGFHYKLGEKYFIRNDYITALKHYRKALEKEPKNLDYNITFATLLADMDLFHQSNNVLFDIINRNSDCPYCYYLMGCNYLALNDYQRAIDCFHKYLEMDQDGVYYDYVVDMLNILETQHMVIEEIKKVDDEYRQICKLLNKSKKLMREGKYSKAIRNMERALDIDDSMLDVKNNLAIAYYYELDIKSAIDISNQVIQVQPDNFNACCNLSIFYKSLDQHQKCKYFIKKAERILKASNDIDYLYKFCVTLCKLGYDSLANKYLKIYVNQKPYDYLALHYLGISYMKLHKFKKALDCWNKIITIKKHDSIALYYKKLAIKSIEMDSQAEHLSYEYQVPEHEFVRRIKLINKLFSLSKNDFNIKWKQDVEIKDILIWGLNLYNSELKIGILKLLSNLSIDECEPILKEYIKKHDEDEKFKQIVFKTLGEKGAKGPYIAYIDGEYVEVRIKQSRSFERNYQDILNYIIDCMKHRYKNLDVKLIYQLWDRINFNKLLKLKNFNLDILSAAFEYYYCRQKDIYMTQKEIAKYYNISTSSLSKRYRWLVDLIKDGEYN